MDEEEFDKLRKIKLEELIELCKSKGIIGFSNRVGKYYAKFEFRKLNEHCPKCGK